MIIVGNEPLEKINTAYYEWKVNEVPDLTLRVARNNNEQADRLLVAENIIYADGHEWRLVSPTVAKNYISVKAIHTFLDLKKKNYNQLKNGSINFVNTINELLNGTGYTVEFDMTNLPTNVVVEDFGRSNVYDLFKELTNSIAGAEFLLMPNKVIKIAKEIKTDNMQQIRYANNIKDIKMTTDVSDIVTSVTIYYGEDLTMSSTFNSSTINNYKQVYETIIEDEGIKTFQAATERAKKEFKDILISYEVDLVSRSIELQPGEEVWTIYEPLQDLKIKTRTLSIRREYDGIKFNSNEAKLGNHIALTGSQVTASETKKNKDDIDEVKKNTKASITVLDDRINLNVTRIGEVESNITLLSDRINLNVSRLGVVESDITLLDNRITLAVNNINGNSSSIELLEQQIQLKVNADGVIAAINLSPGVARIQANKIELNGAVIANGSITGNGNLNITNDIIVGNSIQLGPNQSGQKSIRFNSSANIYSSDSSSLNVSALRFSVRDGDLNLGGPGSLVNAQGIWDFSGANVTGLNVTASNVNGYTFSSTAAGLTVRLNGVYQGICAYI